MKRQSYHHPNFNKRGVGEEGWRQKKRRKRRPIGTGIGERGDKKKKVQPSQISLSIVSRHYAGWLYAGLKLHSLC